MPEKQRDALYKSMLPDVDSTPRAKVSLKNTQKELTILIEAKDAAALRASFNTMTRLVGVAKDAVDTGD